MAFIWWRLQVPRPGGSTGVGGLCGTRRCQGRPSPLPSWLPIEMMSLTPANRCNRVLTQRMPNATANFLNDRNTLPVGSVYTPGGFPLSVQLELVLHDNTHMEGPESGQGGGVKTVHQSVLGIIGRASRQLPLYCIIKAVLMRSVTLILLQLTSTETHMKPGFESDYEGTFLWCLWGAGTTDMAGFLVTHDVRSVMF